MPDAVPDSAAFRSPLEPITAFGARTPREDRIGGVTISERPDTALASLTARRGVTLTEALPGLALPGPGGHAGGPEGTGAMWLGPGAWLVEGRPGDLAGRLKAAHGDRASVTDQTDAWVRFDIAAADTAPLMERLYMLDTRRMAEGSGSRSVIEHLGCLVIIREAGRRLSILGPRSSAGSLLHALTTAAAALQGLEVAA